MGVQAIILVLGRPRQDGEVSASLSYIARKMGGRKKEGREGERKEEKEGGGWRKRGKGVKYRLERRAPMKSALFQSVSKLIRFYSALS